MVIEHHDEGNLQEEEYILAYGSRGLKSMIGKAWQQVAGVVAWRESWELTSSTSSMKERGRGENEK